MPQPLTGSTVTATEIPYSAFPCTNPRAIRFRANFAAVDEYDVDLNNAIELKQIDGVQSLWVDNFDNAQPVIFLFGSTNFRLVVPAGTQGFFPVLGALPTAFTISSPGSADVTSFQVLNFPVPCQFWQP